LDEIVGVGFRAHDLELAYVQGLADLLSREWDLDGGGGMMMDAAVGAGVYTDAHASASADASADSTDAATKAASALPSGGGGAGVYTSTNITTNSAYSNETYSSNTYVEVQAVGVEAVEVGAEAVNVQLHDTAPHTPLPSQSTITTEELLRQAAWQGGTMLAAKIAKSWFKKTNGEEGK
ncbi:hypothetical protein B484DRAFT_406270, partial [Ochromonadaceae sp. CCMP2298]